MASSIAQRRALKSARRRKIVARKRRQEGNKATTVSVDQARLWANGPVHSCLIRAGLFETGLGTVVLARRAGIGGVAVAGVLVDVYCRGVTDVLLQRMSLDEFGWFLGDMGSAAPWQSVDASYARKLLREAAAYSQSLGFTPPRDFAAVEALFGDISADDCDTVFRFGHDGKPCYIAGPNESQGTIRKTLQRLRNRLGDSGFTYIVSIDEIGFVDDDLWHETLPAEGPQDEIPF